MTALGWTADEVDRHDLLDVAALARHWRTSPPTHVTLAGLLGTDKHSATTTAAQPPAARPTTKDMSDDEVAGMEKMLRSFAGAFGSSAAPST